jgi:hypothetical protein
MTSSPRNPTQHQGKTGTIGNAEQQEGIAAILLSQQTAGLSSRAEHQQDQAKLIEEAHDRTRTGRKREKLGERCGRQKLQYKWSEQDAGQDFSYDAWLL